jgi:arylsulfatase A-like enzyme
MNPRLFCVLAIFLTCPVWWPVGEELSATETDAPRNVVFILADDLGWRDLSNEGSSFYESPHIDRIAKEGTKFVQGYATCQVCSPSRASIMTGKYPARLDITDWIGAAMGTQWQRNTRLLPATYETQLPAGDTTIAEAFRAAGYRTFFAGKWHLGGAGSLPTDHGFEFNVGGHHRGSPPGGYFSPYNNPQMSDGPKGELLPLRLGQETARFIEAHQNEPFFAFLSFYSVHGPIQTKQSLWEKYRVKAEQQPSPDHRFIIDRTTPVRQVQDNPLYAGMVESMDDAVGTVLETLDRLKLTDRTVIVFTSDNGGVSAGDGKATSNLPLRGGKGRQWEGGIREPYYIRWNEAAVRESEVLATGTDFYPTLLEICGIPTHDEQHVDGLSLVPALKNDRAGLQSSGLTDRRLFWHYPHYGNQGGEPSSIIRHGDWKLIYYHEDSRLELYDVGVDIGEQRDVARNQPDVTARLKSELDEWLAETAARLPTPNPKFDTAAFEKQKMRIREQQLPRLEREHANFLEPDYHPRQGWWEETGK